MAVYYVDGVSGTDGAGVAGGTGTPWKTISYAIGRAAAGDTINVRTATYREEVTVPTTKPGLIIQADAGASPTIDGKYTPSLRGDQSYKTWTGATIGATSMPSATTQNKNIGGWPMASCQGSIVTLNANQVVFKGIAIRNVAGQAIGVLGNSIRVEDCLMDFMYSGAMELDGDNCLIKNCTIMRGSMKFFDPSRYLVDPVSKNPWCGNGPESVQTTVVVKGSGNIIDGCNICYNCAEGIALAKTGRNCIIRDCVVHDNMHWNLGINGHYNGRIERTISYYCPNVMRVWGKNKMPNCLTMGDEKDFSRSTGGPFIINCLFVGGDGAIVVGNGRTQETLNLCNNPPVPAGTDCWPRPFQFNGAYLGYCTFVSVPAAAGSPAVAGSTRVANFGVDAQYKHNTSVWENCVFWKHPDTSKLATSQTGWGTGCTFRNNIFSSAIAAPFSGTDSIVQSADVLKNPTAPLVATLDLWAANPPNPNSTTFNIANYEPMNSPGHVSPAIGGASNRSASPVNGLVRPEVTVDVRKAARTDLGGGRFFDIGAIESGGVVANSVTANFICSPQGGPPGVSVAFTDLSSVTGNAVVNKWTWNFGDGTTSSLQNPTHVYAVAGNYTPTLVVEDTVRGLSDDYTGPAIAVSADSVTANFTRTPGSGAAPLSVAFTDTSTDSGAATINKWTWNFGDGTTSSLQNPTHVYTDAGEFTPRLTVEDTVRGLSSTKTGVAIRVDNNAARIEPGFSRTPGHGVAPIAIQFNDESVQTGGAVANKWTWNFGDGGTSSLQNPSHTYTTPGTYIPSLTIEDTVRSVSETVYGYAIEVSAAGAINAAFTQSAYGGSAPLEVVFTNRSVAIGTIASSVWDFGDGNTTTVDADGDITHAYGVTGSYTPSLRVIDGNGVADSQVGDPITVAAPAGGKAFDVVRVPSAQSSTITFDLDGRTPSLILVWLCGAQRVDDPASDVDRAMISAGFAVSTNKQFVSSAISADGANPSRSQSTTVDGLTVYEGVDPGGVAVSGKIALVSVGPNTATFNIAAPIVIPNSYIVAAAFAGVVAAIGAEGVDDGDIIKPDNFTPDFYFQQSTEAPIITYGLPNALQPGFRFLAGLATRAAQYAYAFSDTNNVTPTQVKSALVSGQLFASVAVQGVKARVSDWSTGTLSVSGGTKAGTMTRAAVKLPTGSNHDLRLLQSPTATGAQAVNLGWAPDGLIIVASMHDTLETFDPAADGEGFAVCIASQSACHSVAISSKPGLAASNTHSHLDTQLRVYFGGNVVGLEAAVSLTPTGYSFDWTKVRPEGKYLFALAFRVHIPAITMPVAEFVASPLVSDSGIVKFTNLSTNATSFLWDFGDSTASIEISPEHEYLDSGVYTVSLTSTNNSGSDTETKEAYVTVRRDGVMSYAGLGPYVPVTTTNYTTNDLHDDPGDELLGRSESGLDMDVLYIDVDPNLAVVAAALAGVRSGKVAFYVDVANDRLVIKYPPGVTGPGGATERYLPLSAANITANFTQSSTGGDKPLAVNFTDTSTEEGGANIDEWAWNFGDDGTSSAQNPSHTYTNVGTYIPSLQVRDSVRNLIATKTGSPIVVTQGAIPPQTVTIQPAASGDDGREDGSQTVVISGASVSLTSALHLGGLRFPNVTVPAGATITAAKLQFFVVTNDSPGGLAIKAQTNVNAAAITTAAGNISARSLGPNSIVWSDTAIGLNAWKDSPDITAVVRDVFNRPDWVSGKTVFLVLDAASTTSFAFRTFDHSDGTLAPKLVITYTPAS